MKNPSTEGSRRVLVSTVEPVLLIYGSIPSWSEDEELVVKSLFDVNDRAIRGVLLKCLPSMCKRASSKLTNKIFEPLCSGFTDSSSPLRELTLKSVPSLVDDLSASNKEKLSRYLTRMQSDAEPGIRTNTVILIGKIASKLPHNAKRKLCVPSFQRALKDPFHPCRVAGLKSLSSSSKTYEPSEICSMLLPIVCPLLLDTVGEVRDEAYRVHGVLIDIARKKMIEMNEKQDRVEGSKAPVPVQKPQPAATYSGNGGGSSSGMPYAAMGGGGGGSSGSSSLGMPFGAMGAGNASSALPANNSLQDAGGLGGLGFGLPGSAGTDGGDGEGWSDDDFDDNAFAASPDTSRGAGPRSNGRMGMPQPPSSRSGLGGGGIPQAASGLKSMSIKGMGNGNSGKASGSFDTGFFDEFSVPPPIPTPSSLKLPAKSSKPLVMKAKAKTSLTQQSKKLEFDGLADGWDDF